MFLDVTPWADGAAVRQTTAFVDCLADLSAGAWLAIGRSGVAEGARGRYATASALLDATAADQRLHAEAWHIRDLVASATHYALPASVRTSREERQALTAACALAERAALALLVRRSISRSDFAALYAPFTKVLPPGALGVPAQALDDTAGWPSLQSRIRPREGAPREA